MKTATVELEAGGVGCHHGQFVNLDLRWFSWCWWLRVDKAVYKGFFCERRKCDGAPPAVQWRCTAVQLHRRGARTTEKKIWCAIKGARPLSPIFLSFWDAGFLSFWDAGIATCLINEVDDDRQK
jgi:hypothetical protein